jgi:hexokinase
MIAPVPVQRPQAVKQALSFLGKKEEPTLRAEVPLSPALDEEFNTMKASFTVTTGMLKEITNRFQKELDAGLQKPKQNIVSTDSPTFYLNTNGSPPRTHY